jgi:hypothetical protein
MHFLLLVFVALGSTSYVQDVPLFVWSGDESYIASRNQQIRGYYTTESVGELLQGFWKHGDRHGLLNVVKSDQQLELVVVLVNAALSSEELSVHSCCLSTLDETMASHPSFYVPYVSVTDSSITHGARKACHKAQTSGATAYYLGPDTFLSHLEKHAPLTNIKTISEIVPAFTNGKTDILVVYLDSEHKIMQIHETIEALTNTFQTASFSSYVVALTSADSSLELPSNEELGIAGDVRRAIFAVPGPSNGTFPPPIYNGRNTFNVYFNGVFWELFFVLIVFWSIIIMGLKLLLQVQAPDRIPNLNNKAKKNK